ncbi:MULTISPECIES: DLW-39 family protein [unclassified Geodermatophilus]
MLKQLALVAAAAGAVAALRRRSAGTGKAEADLWHEATSGPDAVSRPTTR